MRNITFQQVGMNKHTQRQADESACACGFIFTDKAQLGPTTRRHVVRGLAKVPRARTRGRYNLRGRRLGVSNMKKAYVCVCVCLCMSAVSYDMPPVCYDMTVGVSGSVVFFSRRQLASKISTKRVQSPLNCVYVPQYMCV